MEIGEAIRKARKAKGFSLQELAKRAGITYNTIHFWESGKVSPNVVPLIAVADVLGVTLDELVGRDEIVHCNECCYLKNICGVNWCNKHDRATQNEDFCGRGKKQ